MVNKKTQLIYWPLQIVLAFVLFLCLCFTNYKVSTWILVQCGHSLWYFFPTFVGTLCTMSVFFYVVMLYFSRVYVSHLIKSLEKLDLVEFSCLMAQYKERQYNRKSPVDRCQANATNTCLICYEFPAGTLTRPCEHQVMCGRCAWKYIAMSAKDCQPLKCILCRTEATEYNGDIAIELSRLNLTEFQNILKMKHSEGESKNHSVMLTRMENEIFTPCVS